MTSLDDLAPVVGYSAARLIAHRYAGRVLCVPVDVRPSAPLALLIGLPALRALVREYAGERFAIPCPEHEDRERRNLRIAEMLAAGAPVPAVAAAVGLTPRRVEQLRAELVAAGWLESAGPRRGVSLAV